MACEEMCKNACNGQIFVLPIITLLFALTLCSSGELVVSRSSGRPFMPSLPGFKSKPSAACGGSARRNIGNIFYTSETLHSCNLAKRNRSVGICNNTQLTMVLLAKRTLWKANSAAGCQWKSKKRYSTGIIIAAWNAKLILEVPRWFV